MIDVLGDAIADVTLRTGSDDPCEPPGHAIEGAELVEVLRSFQICRVDANTAAGFFCSPLPLDAQDITAGSRVLLGE